MPARANFFENTKAWWGACFAGGLLVFSLHIAFTYFYSSVAAGLVASSLLALVVLICTGTGRIVLGFFKAQELSESENTLIGCTLGLGILTQSVFLLGIFGLVRLWAVLGLLAVLWIAGFTEMRRALVSLGANRNLLRERPLWTAGILAFLGCAFWTAWIPPHQYDSLVYHLPLASDYVQKGKIVPIPQLLFSHFPQNGEMFFTLALLLKSDLLAQLFSWLMSLLSVLWVFEMGKREMPLPAALGACALLASHTGVMLLSSTAYVEPMVMLWITASVLSFCRWHETRGTAQSPRGWLALSAIFAGLGLGTKYYAGICPTVLCLMLLVRWSASILKGNSTSKSQRAKDFGFFLFLSAAAGSPWLIKNWVMVGNPVFPFLYDRFPHYGVPWAAETAKRYFDIFTAYGHSRGHFFSDLLKFPYWAASGDLRFGGGMDVLGDLGWGLLFVLAPVGFVAAWKNRTLRLAWIYCALHWAVWFSTGTVLRFLIVIVPLACLVTAAGLHRVWGALGGKGRALLAAALAVFTAVNLGLFLYVHTVLSSWTVLLGVENREDYLSRRLDYYPCARFARERLGENDKILVVGEQRGYYVTQDHVTTTPVAPNPFIEWSNRARDPQDLARILRAEGGFTHLMVVPREAQRLLGYGIFDFTDRGWENWSGLEKGFVNSLYAAGTCALFEIKK